MFKAQCDYCDGQGCHHCDPPKAPCCGDHDYYLKKIRKLRVLLRTQNDYLDFLEGSVVTPKLITHTQRGDCISVAFREIAEELRTLAKEESEEKVRREQRQKQHLESLKRQRDKLESEILAAEQAKG